MPAQDPGTIGRYHIIRRLGSGAVGAVYLASDPLIDRQVAIKLLRSDDADADDAGSDPAVRERFLREAQAAGRLAHPNIVTIYDFGEFEGQPFIAMEYVDGDTLAYVIRTRQPLPLTRKLEIVEQVCNGLDYAHRAGLVHRDVKPGNVLVARDGGVKILDFGIARLSNWSITQVGAMLGTPYYMAPEQVMGQDVGFQADIFGVGALLFELVTWQRPFEAEAISTVFYKVIHEEPPPVSSLVQEATPALDAIVARALRKQPEQRYTSLKEMSEALARIRREMSGDGDTLAVRSTPSVSSTPPAASMLPDLTEQRERAVARTLSQVRDTFDRGDVDAARDLLERALLIDPEDPGLRAAQLAVEAAEQVNRPPGAGNAPARRDSAGPGRSGRPWPAIDDSHAGVAESLMPVPADGADQTISAPRATFAPPPRPAPPPPADLREQTVVLSGAALELPDGDLSQTRLVVTESADPRVVGRSIPLEGSAVLLGRRDAWLQIADAQWSRRHAEIQCTERGFVIRDLESQNGTRVNGYRISGTPQPILFGSRIGIGSTVLTFSHVHEMRMPDLTGMEIGGRYVLEDRLRDGAKAALYAARDKRLTGRVALKLLSPELARYPDYRQRFQREAELARQLHHPHICQVLDYGPTDLTVGGTTMRTYFLCLELMEGGNLFDRLERRDRFEWPKVAQWIERLASALSLAHRRGLVHRDLKPSAVVFDGDDNPYVTDFAIAQQSGTDQMHVLGTPAYMAPEMWQPGVPGPMVDQFGLAVLAYYLITGSRPFEGQEQPEIRRRNFLQGPLPAHLEAHHNGRPGLLRGVSAVLAKALAASPDDRFESVTAFANALSASLIRPTRPLDAPQLFFSYQRESTSGWVNYFADRLRAVGLTVFVDTHNRDSNGIFPEQIARTIEDCTVFVCFLGEKTLESRWVRDEINLAHQYGKSMIPVFQEGYARPDAQSVSRGVERLLTSQGIHLHDRRNLNPEQSATDLAILAKRSLDDSRDA